MSKSRQFLGLCCGLAADGVDVALIRVDGSGAAMRVESLASTSRLLPEGERRRLLTYGSGKCDSLRALAELDRDLAIDAAAAAERLLEEQGIDSKGITAAGWSGWPITLEAPGRSHRMGAMLEVGSPAVLAERLAMPVVSGFAASDLAVGGTGGPMDAWPNWLLFRHERLSRIVVHLGAIATMTFLPADADPMDVEAFDVGPGTALLDGLMHKFHHSLWDSDGSVAAAGRCHAPLLNELLSHPYFQSSPPKHTDYEPWGTTYLWRVLQMARRHEVSEADLVATCCEMTARSIANAIAERSERPHEILLHGGGALNIHLAGRIRSLMSPSSTYTVEKYGMGLRACGAVHQALLAAVRLDGLTIHCPQATGAATPYIPGAVTLPSGGSVPPTSPPAS